MTPNYLIDMLEKPFEMESLLTLIRHLLAFELTRFFLFPPPIYKIAMEKARWGAVYPETHRLVLKIEGNCSRLRAKPAHMVGHLPPRNHSCK
jgi:hypothetical protein